jgi:hypothetical protein
MMILAAYMGQDPAVKLLSSREKVKIYEVLLFMEVYLISKVSSNKCRADTKLLFV